MSTPKIDELEEKMDALENLVKRLETSAVDEELRKENRTFRTLLYGAIARMGVSVPNDTNVLTTAQIPMVQVPQNHDLQWEVSKDGRSVLLYIVTVGDNARTEFPDEGDGGGETGSEKQSPPPDPGEARDVEIGNLTARMPLDPVDNDPYDVGDEFEDAIVVGMPEDKDGN